METALEKGLTAIIPKYLPEGGNCTVLYTKEDKPLILANTIATVIKRIGKYYMIDLEAMRAAYGKLLNTTNLVPIPLNKKDILIPIRVRKSIGKNDKAYGYMNIRYIRDVKSVNGVTIIYLLNGERFETISSVNNINYQISKGIIVQKCYEDRFKRYLEENATKSAEARPRIYEDDKTIVNVFVSNGVISG